MPSSDPTVSWAPAPTPRPAGWSKIWPVYIKSCFVHSNHSPLPLQLYWPSALKILRPPFEKGILGKFQEATQPKGPGRGTAGNDPCSKAHILFLNPWLESQGPQGWKGIRQCTSPVSSWKGRGGGWAACALEGWAASPKC